MPKAKNSARCSLMPASMNSVCITLPPQINSVQCILPQQGNSVQWKLTTSDELKDQPWYKDVDHKEGQSIISKIKEEGAFIVRPDDKKTGSFVLIVWANGEIHNLKINKNNGGDASKHYTLLEKGNLLLDFSSVIQLVEKFSHICIRLKDGISVKLQQSVNAYY